MSTHSPADRDTAAGIARVEGYLLCQAELRTAREDADEFLRRLPWLTSGQSEEVRRHYVRQRVALSKQMLQAVADRGDELQREYSARYRALRRRLLCAGGAAAVVSTVLCGYSWRIGG